MVVFNELYKYTFKQTLQISALKLYNNDIQGVHEIKQQNFEPLLKKLAHEI